MPAAAVGAFALVGAAVGKIIGNQTAAGVRHAHGAMHKTFEQNVRTLPADFLHLLKGDFPSEHTEFGSLLLPELDGQRGADVGLSGNEKV